MPRVPNPSLYRLEPPLALAATVTELAATPRHLRMAVAEANADALVRPGPGGGWSAFQVVCHFRDAALVYSLRFRFIVFDSEPLLPNYDENNWVAAARDRVEDLPEILNEIAASRSDLVRVLGHLEAAAWMRTGRHEVLGAVVLRDYVPHQLAHERQHLAQIRAALGATMP